jgi:hypothetical protein
VSNKISRLLTKYNIKTIHILVKNIHMLRPIQDKLGLKVASLYCVPCDCSRVCVGQTGRFIKTGSKEHMRHIRMGQPEKSAMAEHRNDTGHSIDFKSISILDKATGYMDSIIKEAIEIRLHPNKFNRDSGLTLSRSWYPVTNMIKEDRHTPIRKQGQAKQALDYAH